MRAVTAAVLSVFFFTCYLSGQEEKQPTLFDNAVEALEKNFVYEDFRTEKLPAIVDRYRPKAEMATTLDEQRQVIHEMLANIPATHMGLLSESTFDHLIGDLGGRLQPTFGFELMELDGKQFAHSVLEGGPAYRAGLLRGDRIVLIDGVSIDGHARLDWRSDDSFLVDPAVRRLHCEEGDTITITLERKWGETIELEVTAEEYSAFEAAKASAMTIDYEGKKFGFIHFWYIHISGVPSLLKEKLEGEFADCDAVIVDWRGRGGNGGAIQPICDVLAGRTCEWDKPVIGLVNQYSRSAKEVITYELRKQNIATMIGEQTAGAVIPASFKKLGYETVLMYPTFEFGNYTSILEGKGAEVDIYVKDAGPYSAGADPLLGAALKEAARQVEEAAVGN